MQRPRGRRRRPGQVGVRQDTARVRLRSLRCQTTGQTRIHQFLRRWWQQRLWQRRGPQGSPGLQRRKRRWRGRRGRLQVWPYLL